MKQLMIVLFLVAPISCFSQNIEEVNRFGDLFEVEVHTHNYKEQLKDNRNEVSFVFSALFVMYKEVFSSQDIDMCVFTPSCSVYAIEVVKEKGLVIGYFSAIDRLTRCNPGQNKNLPIDPLTGKYYDPIDF